MEFEVAACIGHVFPISCIFGQLAPSVKFGLPADQLKFDGDADVTEDPAGGMLGQSVPCAGDCTPRFGLLTAAPAADHTAAAIVLWALPATEVILVGTAAAIAGETSGLGIFSGRPAAQETLAPPMFPLAAMSASPNLTSTWRSPWRASGN